MRLACFARVEGEATVTLQAPAEAQTGENSPAPSEPAGETEPLGFAADIGTTTVALSLFGLKSRRLLSTESALNPQRTFGADVIARIDAAGKGRFPPCKHPLWEPSTTCFLPLAKRRGRRWSGCKRASSRPTPPCSTCCAAWTPPPSPRRLYP